MKRKLFISYHRMDEKAVLRVKRKVTETGYQVYSVPTDADYDGWTNEAISQDILKNMTGCDVVIVIIGPETYQRPHVDREIHEALKGGPGVRKGVIAVFLESRSDSIRAMDSATIPARLNKNADYVLFIQNGQFASSLDDLVEEACLRRGDPGFAIDNTAAMSLRKGKYFDAN